MNPEIIRIVCDPNPKMARSYPYWGKSDGDIVFFTGPRTGYGFGSEKKNFKPMYHSERWTECIFEVMEVSEIDIKEKVSTIISHNTKL